MAGAIRTSSTALLVGVLIVGMIPAASADDDPDQAVAQAPDAGDPLPPNTPAAARCAFTEHRCTIAPGTVRISWTLEVTEDRPVDFVNVRLELKRNTSAHRLYALKQLEPDATHADFDELLPGDDVRAHVTAWGPGGLAGATVLPFLVKDVTPNPPVIDIEDPTRPGRIDVWVHPALDVDFYQGITLQLQRYTSSSGWTTIAEMPYPARAKVALPDTGCPLGTVCRYRARSQHDWGTTAWTDPVSQRSFPVPTQPKLTARPSAAGRIETAATPTTKGAGTWYDPHRYQIQRNHGSGWTAWATTLWGSGLPVVRTDRDCPISTVCRYRVRTLTPVGPSSWTTVSQRSMGPPTAVRNVAGSSPRSQTAWLTWSAPTSDAGRPVGHYEVWSGGVRYYRGTDRSATLTRLPPGKITFTIRAVNKWGNGPSIKQGVTVRR